MSNLTYLTESLRVLNEADDEANAPADKSNTAQKSNGADSYTELISDAGCSLYKINNYEGIKTLGKYSKWDISGWADGDFSEAKRIYNDKIRKFLLRGGKGGFYVITTKNPRVKYLFAVNNIGQIVSIFDINGNNISLSDIKSKLSTVAIYNYIIKAFKIKNNQSSEVKSKKESLLKEDDNSDIKTITNEKDLIELIAKMPYEKAVKELQKICSDASGALKLLKKAFQPGEQDVSAKETAIKVTDLYPTQSEIDLDKSLAYPLQNADSIKNCFSSPVMIKAPIITFQNKYILDGHHRWSQVYCINPNAQMKAIDINIVSANDPIDALKVLQAAIAAQTGTIKVNTVDGQSIYNVDKQAVLKYVSNKLSEDSYEALREFVKGLSDRASAIKYITRNTLLLKKNNRPASGAPNRGLMPQTDSDTISTLVKTDTPKVFESVHKSHKRCLKEWAGNDYVAVTFDLDGNHIKGFFTVNGRRDIKGTEESAKYFISKHFPLAKNIESKFKFDYPLGSGKDFGYLGEGSKFWSQELKNLIDTYGDKSKLSEARNYKRSCKHLTEQEWVGNLTNHSYETSIPAQQSRSVIQQQELADYSHRNSAPSSYYGGDDTYSITFNSQGDPYRYAAIVTRNFEPEDIVDFLSQVIKDVSDIKVKKDPYCSWFHAFSFKPRSIDVRKDAQTFLNLIDKKAMDKYARENRRQLILY